MGYTGWLVGILIVAYYIMIPSWLGRIIPYIQQTTRVLIAVNLVGGFNPFEKYAREIGSFPQGGVNIKNIWNHHPVTWCLINSWRVGCQSMLEVRVIHVDTVRPIKMKESPILLEFWMEGNLVLGFFCRKISPTLRIKWTIFLSIEIHQISIILGKITIIPKPELLAHFGEEP